MNKKIATLIISIAIPLGAGIIAGLLTMGGMKDFGSVIQPPLSPPGWIFPIVWTILYILMGYASYLIYTSDASEHDIKNALKYYVAQLAVNFLWSFIFFSLKWYFTAFISILLLWTLIFLTIREFYKINKTAAYLLIPYLIWVTFAGYLTAGITLLN